MSNNVWPVSWRKIVPSKSGQKKVSRPTLYFAECCCDAQFYLPEKQMILRLVPILEVFTFFIPGLPVLSIDFTTMGGGVIAIGAILGDSVAEESWGRWSYERRQVLRQGERKGRQLLVLSQISTARSREHCEKVSSTRRLAEMRHCGGVDQRLSRDS